MKCFSDELIQAYIDQEVSDNERLRMEKHLVACESCAKRVKLQRENAIRIKKMLGSLNSETIEIPRFCVTADFRAAQKSKRKKLLWLAAAACVIFLLLVLYPKPKAKVEVVYLFDVASDFNANLPLSQQSMVWEKLDAQQAPSNGMTTIQ